MSKFLHRQRGLVFAILLISLSVTTVLWSTNIMTSVSLLESTAAGTKPDDDIRANIPDSIRQQNAPIRYNKNSSKKRPWNQPDLTFTLKSSAADGSSSSRTNRLERIKHPRSQNAIKRNVEDQKEDNQNEDDKVKKEGEDQNEEEEDDTTKDETQVRNKTKSTRVKEKARTKTKKRRTTRKKKRRDER